MLKIEHENTEIRELKPCPFCGACAKMYEDERFSFKPASFPKWYITCIACKIRTPTTLKEDAVKRWNQRKIDKEISEMLDFKKLTEDDCK